MTRAGKEPDEDVKRAFRRAIELAGLVPSSVRTYKVRERESRNIHGTASPEDWPHEDSAVELLGTVGFDGTISEIQIRCSATDDDSLTSMFRVPTLRQCNCTLTDLPAVLKSVWVARRGIIDRLKAGEPPPLFDGRWTWAVPSLSLPEME